MSFKNFYFNKIIFSFVFLFVLFFANSVFAAELSISPSFSSYKVGDNIKVRINMSSGVSANAVSGNLKFSNNTLMLDSISKTNSVVNLWAVEPSFSNSSGTVSFEGVILSGYSGSNGNVLTLNFKAKSSGTANISFTNSSILANDGEGTEILTSSGRASFPINTVVEKVIEKTPVKEKVETKIDPKPEVKKEEVVPAVVNILPSIQIQKTSSDDSIESFASFNISSIGKKSKSDYKVEIDGIPFDWANQESGVITTSSLPRGSHKLSVSMETINGDVLSSSVSFSILSIPAPVVIEYSESVNENNYITLKGRAEPYVDVIIVIDTKSKDGKIIESNDFVVRSDEFGSFTYLSDKVVAGTYDIRTYYRVKSGLESEKSAALMVNVYSSNEMMLNKITNTFSVLIVVIALIILLLIVATWGWYKFLTYKDKNAKKLADSRVVINKSFDILDDDLNQQVKILKKINSKDPLTAEELKFLKQFKKDIRAAEKVIIDEVKDIKK